MRVTAPAARSIPSGFHRARRVLARTVAALVVVVVGGYLVFNGLALVQSQSSRHGVAADLTDRLPAATAAARAHRLQVDRALGAQASSWTVQRCSFPTDDTGWMVRNYRQECRLLTVSVQAVDDLRDATGMATSLPLPSDAMDVGTGSGPCVELVRWRAPDLTPDAPSVRGATITAWFADLSDASARCDANAGYGEHERVVAGQPLDLGPSAWLVVQREEPLVDEAIGCARWSVVFCTEPYTKPAFGRLPRAQQ